MARLYTRGGGGEGAPGDARPRGDPRDRHGDPRRRGDHRVRDAPRVTGGRLPAPRADGRAARGAGVRGPEPEGEDRAGGAPVPEPPLLVPVPDRGVGPAAAEV